MDSYQPATPMLPPSLVAALERLWQRHLPEFLDRLDILDSVAAAVATGVLTSEQQESAHAAAHKLAGTLGSFGLVEATAPAREIESLCAPGAAPSRESAARLAQLAATLRSLVESRQRPHTPAG